MSKTKAIFACTECHSQSLKWSGKCTACGAWDSLEEQTVKSAPQQRSQSFLSDLHLFGGDVAEAVKLFSIEEPAMGRTSTGLGELDAVLGGGVVQGSVVLVAGDPGIGKSTLMMQAAMLMSKTGTTVLYATSEESAYQCRIRAERLNLVGSGSTELDSLLVLSDTSLERITEQVNKHQPQVLVIDSIQMVHRGDVEATVGSVAQIKRCCLELIYLARQLNMSVLVVGHMTKEGHIAGPRVLEHLVDVVLTFEGDRHHALRGLRGMKNRFGTTLDIGLFEMTQQGLKEVQDAASFIDVQSPTRIGTVVCPTMHGSRCLLVEVQSLVTSGVMGQARRRATGLDGSRITRIAAVLEQHAQLKLADQDIYAHAVGGLKLDEPATDLPICLAILSAYHDLVMPQQTCAFGEVGLGGEIRAVPHLKQRVAQARKHGYSRIIIPITQQSDVTEGALGVATIEDLRPLLTKNPISVTSTNRLSDEEKGGFDKCG